MHADTSIHQKQLTHKRPRDMNTNKRPKKLLDQACTELCQSVRDALRAEHYSIHTEKTYVQWIKRYILFHDKRHPRDMRAPEIASFLTHLSVDLNVAAPTQNPCTEPAEVRPSAPRCSCTATCSKKTW